MDAIEFIRNIFKGENIAECENHLESFLKQKVQELLPEHFGEIERYKRISALQEACSKESEPDDDDEGDIDESLPEDAKEKIEKALKTIKDFKKIKSYEVERNNVAVVKAEFSADLEDDEEVTSIKSQITNAIKKQKLKVEFVSSKDTDYLSFEVLA